MSLRWQADRSHINHGWLQNGVLVGLRHAQSISRGTVRSRAPRGVISENVWRWMEGRGEVLRLLNRFEDEMSPRVLFQIAPLCRCSDATKRWLVPVIHELWMDRGRIREKIKEVQTAYEAVERTYEDALAVIERLPVSPSSTELHPVDEALGSLATSCEQLSQFISALPRDIQCV